MNVNDILNFTGTGFAIVLLILNLLSRRTLMGSFFKGYYTLMTAAMIALVISFLADLPITPLGMEVAEIVHHLFFIVFTVLAVVAARYLPKEAAKHLEKD